MRKIVEAVLLTLMIGAISQWEVEAAPCKPKIKKLVSSKKAPAKRNPQIVARPQDRSENSQSQTRTLGGDSMPAIVGKPYWGPDTTGRPSVDSNIDNLGAPDLH